MIFARTDRLILRKAREEDVEPLLLSWSDPDMTRYTGLRPNIRQFLAGMIADLQRKNPGDTEPGGPWYQYVVQRAAAGALVGDVGVGLGVPGERPVAPGSALRPAHHRQGQVSTQRLVGQR